MSDTCVTLVSKKLIPIANGTPFFRNFASLDLENYEPDSDFMDKLYLSFLRAMKWQQN